MNSTAIQPGLFDICDLCGRPWSGTGHRACFKAVELWFRLDNRDSWAADFQRAAEA